MIRKWPVLIALSCAPQLAAAQAAGGAQQPGMVITGDREAPLVLYIVPWQEPKPVVPPQMPGQELMPPVVDHLRSVLDEPENRPPGPAAKAPALR